MAMNAGWQGQERRSGGDRRTMLLDRPEQERRVAERRRDSEAGDDRVRAAGGSRGGGMSGSDTGSTPGANRSSATGVSVGSNPEKDPEDWTTGDEPMTGPQRSYLHTLAREAGELVPENLSKADASRLIDELQARSGRGANPSDGIG